MTGLLNGRGTIRLFVPTRHTDDLGMTCETYSEPITMACTPQWKTPVEVESLGYPPQTQVVVVARHWATTTPCVFFWEGKTFEQVGSTKVLYGSARTRHVEVAARQIADSEVDPRQK